MELAASGKWRIDNVTIVRENDVVEGSVVVENGVIAAVDDGSGAASGSSAIADGAEIVDGRGGLLLPGFIDVHVHGGYGGDFMDATAESFDTITRFHASKGTTAMLATTVTASREAIEAVLEAAAAYRAGGMPYAAIAGVHLEGPFISEKWPGAQNPAFISPPRLDWVRSWVERHPGLIRQLTLAPEKEGALDVIAWLAERGIVAACGHTDARYDEIAAAADAGLSQAVHTYNAMKPLHHREPGTVGAVLTDKRLHAELIADGHHVHPAAIRLLVAAKPSDRVILITDAMSAAGLGNGEYAIGGLAVVVKDGVARLRDGDSLAGSTLTMVDAFRFMLEHTDLGVVELSRMASANPARQLGLLERTGTIAAGKQADLVLTDKRLTAVHATWVGGRQVFAAR